MPMAPPATHRGESKRKKMTKKKNKPSGNDADDAKNQKRKRIPLGLNRAKTSKEKIQKKNRKLKPSGEEKEHVKNEQAPVQQFSLSAFDQLDFFLSQFQSANGIKLSSIELDSIKDTCMLRLSEELGTDVSNLSKHLQPAFGSSWKEVLCEGRLIEGKVEPGSPAVLVISASAIRSLELLKGLRSLTKECQAVKLFSKHIKVEDQVSLLKKRVNIASGTPSRIKKLCEMEALGLSRLELILLDMHTDVKGYSLFTLPQVRDEFWDLYKSFFHQQLMDGRLRVCLYGPVPVESSGNKAK